MLHRFATLALTLIAQPFLAGCGQAPPEGAAAARTAASTPPEGQPAPAGRPAESGGEPCPFGIASSGESFGDHARLFPLLREAGVGMVRSFPEWPSFQPEKGKWDWSHGDALVESARKSQVQLEGVLCYLAPWASSAAPGETDHGKRTRTFPIKDMQDWRDYVAGVVARYRKDIQHWEVYNEFNSPGFNRGGTARDYADMVRQAYLVTRKAAPECKIGIGCADVDLSFLEQVITQGAGGCFDFVNVHPYSLMGAAMAGREPVFLGMAANLRKMLAKTCQRPDIRLTDEWWTAPAEPGWHKHTFRLKDANFANNWGWNFRIDVVSSPGDIWVKEVTVRRLGPKK